MIFLKNLFQYLTNLWTRLSGSLINTSPPKIIPDTIDDNELLIRGVLHPIHISSKGKIGEKLFLPPSGRNDVSVLRHNFTDDDFCKMFFTKMENSQTYKGFFLLLAKHVYQVADAVNLTDEIFLKVTPLDDKGEEVTQRPILETLPGIPMHADLCYKDVFTKGQPQTNYREFSRALIKEVNKYYEDPNITSNKWEGPPLKDSFK